MINNRKMVKCGRCGKEGYLTVHADDFDDVPTNFTITEECKGRCETRYCPMSAYEMQKLTGLPLSGWSETQY